MSEQPPVLKPRHLGESSAILHAFSTTHSTVESSSHDPILVISFAGEYQVGAAGDPDAEHLSAVIALGRRLFCPSGIVLDLRDLDYRWGDMMESALVDAIVHHVDPAVVVSDRCREALTSLLLLDSDDAPGDWLFEDLTDALLAVDAGIRLVRDARAVALAKSGEAARRRMWPAEPGGARDRSRRFREVVWDWRRGHPRDEFALDGDLVRAAGAAAAADGSTNELRSLVPWFLSRYERHGLPPVVDALAQLAPDDDLDLGLEQLTTPLLTALTDEFEARAGAPGDRGEQLVRLLDAARRQRVGRLSAATAVTGPG